MNNVNIRKRCSRQSCSSFPPPLTRLYQEALPTCSFQENRLDYKRIQLSFTKRWNLCKVENISQLWIELSFWNSTMRHRPEHQTSLHDLFITFIAPFEPVDHFRVQSQKKRKLSGQQDICRLNFPDKARKLRQFSNSRQMSVKGVHARS